MHPQLRFSVLLMWWCGFVLFLGSGQIVFAAQDRVSEVTIGAVSPTAIRGVDLLIPLRIPKTPIAWPTKIQATIGGSQAEADVAWIVHRLVENPSWTSP